MKFDNEKWSMEEDLFYIIHMRNISHSTQLSHLVSRNNFKEVPKDEGDLVFHTIDESIVTGILQLLWININGYDWIKEHCKLNGIASWPAETINSNSLWIITSFVGNGSKVAPLSMVGCNALGCYAVPTLCGGRKKMIKSVNIKASELFQYKTRWHRLA